MMCEQARFVYLTSTSYTANCVKFPLVWGAVSELLQLC